jgi:hypothetical protein
MAKAPTAGNLQDEFTVHADRTFGDPIGPARVFAIPLCGICGNSGYIRSTWKFFEVFQTVEAYCICANGRAIRKRERGSKWGNSIIKKTPEAEGEGKIEQPDAEPATDLYQEIMREE